MNQQKDIKMNFTIDQKMAGTGSIGDLKSQNHNRVIDFPKDAKYIVVFADHYNIGHYAFKYANDLVDAWLNGADDLEPFRNYSLTVFNQQQNEIDLNKDKDFQCALNDALSQ